MHGLGNDYVYVNCFEEKVTDPEKMALDVSDRHFGVGSDGLVLIMPSKTTDFRMRIFNADGSEAEMCGNGVRCIYKYVYDHGLTEKKRIGLETKAGLIMLEMGQEKHGKVETVRVDMGPPRLLRQEIPMLGTEDEKVIDEVLEVEGRPQRVTCVSMGNPHCVTFVDELESLNLSEIGPIFENHRDFPERINTEFIQVMGPKEIKMRVWERGSGETMACGTGACASVVASALNKKTERKVTVHLLGGDLDIEWREDDHVYMTGPAEEVFIGELP